MIFTDRTITVKKGASSIDDTIVLYRGDKEVEIRFTLNESSPFRFGIGAEPNIIEKTEAAYGQLIIKTPNDLPSIFSEIAPTNEGKIIFTITAEMIDEITEVGNYTFQIRLLDESMNSRATLPEVNNGIEIREPIATEDITTTNEVGVATVGYAMTTAGTTEDVFDSQGNYNKTTWGTGDRITAAKLNKMEAGIDGVNKKVANAGGSGSVDLSNYVTKETGNANQITFADGQTFQAKLDAGTLKGDKGDAGVNNIDDTTASASSTYSSNKIENIKGNLSLQINDIASEVNNLKENGTGTGTVPDNVALLEDVTVDGETEDYIPLMALNGTEYRLTINNLGVPIVKNINGDIVFTCGTGSSEGGGDTPSTPIVPEGSWINGVAYSDFGWIDGYYVDKGDGQNVSNSLWSISEYMNCEGADYIEGWCYSGSYNVFYDASKQFISCFDIGSMSGFKNTCVAIPTNVSYFRLSNETSKLSNVNVTPYKKIDANWTDGVPYSLELIANKYYSNGNLTDYNGWSATSHANCSYASKLSILSPNGTISGSYCSFFDINKKALGGISNIAQTTDGTPVEIAVPINACYFALSADTATMTSLTVTPIS